MTSEQQDILEILHVYADLCRRHGLTYMLTGGTLLGAVRHKGFIPWDDDIDIMMPEADYRKFIQIAITDLPEGFVLQSLETDENYPFFFSKICDTRKPFENGMAYKPPGLFIDIFPIVFAKKPNKLRYLMFNINRLITQILMTKSGWIKGYAYDNKLARIGYKLLHRFSPKTLRRIRQALVNSFSVDHETPDVCSIGGIYKAQVEFQKYEWMSSTVPLEFEGFHFPAPVDWDAYLTDHYGDYMTPPPEAQRINHKG